MDDIIAYRKNGNTFFEKMNKMFWCSVGAFHSNILIDLIITNIRHYIGCKMIIHVSNERLIPSNNHSDVVINQETINVTRNGPEVFRLHYSNLKIILNTAHSRDKIILLPGNGIFTKECHNDLNNFEMSYLDMNTRFLKHDPYFLPFYNFIKVHKDPVLDVGSLVRMQHEGSFYRASLLRNIMPFIRRSTTVNYCPIRPCTLEEIVIPTLIWQHFPYLIQNYTTPILHRYFEWNTIKVNITRKRETCGLKLVHDKFEKNTIQHLTLLGIKP